MRARRLLGWRAATAVVAAIALALVALHAAAVQPAVTALPGVRVKLIGEHNGSREYQLVFEPRAELVATLTDFVLRNHLKAAHFVAIGACTDAIIGFYDPDARNYHRTPYRQQMEVVSLIGDAAPTNGDAGLHTHVGLGLSDGTVHGGHLFELHVGPTVEMFLTASPVAVERHHDASLNLDLMLP
jgi:predicted DNA-binding protein with PD1-like motif